jgi:hypothetical protein
MDARYPRRQHTHRWAWVLILYMLTLTARAPRTPEAANAMTQQREIFVESDAYERFMDDGAAGCAPVICLLIIGTHPTRIGDAHSVRRCRRDAVRVTGVDPSRACA